MPAALRGALMPFQAEGVRFGVERCGRCLIADEMGVGKTLQAVALAACYEVSHISPRMLFCTCAVTARGAAWWLLHQCVWRCGGARACVAMQGPYARAYR